MKTWNNTVDIDTRACNSELPTCIEQHPGIRIALTRARPGLSALSFERKMTSLFSDIIRCPMKSNSRLSRDYAKREQGAFNYVAAFNGVIEPQKQGRLHWHVNLYASSLTPELLTRLAVAPEKVKTMVAIHLESTSCIMYQTTAELGTAMPIQTIRSRVLELLT